MRTRKKPKQSTRCATSTDVAADGGPAASGNSTDGTDSGSRRRLTEVEHRARRMMLDFHGTRRTLAEFNDLTDVLSQLGVQNQVPKAKVPKTGSGKKNGGAKVCVGGGERAGGRGRK